MKPETPPPSRPRRLLRASILLAAAAAFLSGGCGYRAGAVYNAKYKTLAIPMFENKTRWRGQEFELTQTVSDTILARTPYRLAPADSADLLLRGEISEFKTPMAVENSLDIPIQSVLQFKCKITLTDRLSGKVIYTNERNETAPITPARGESAESARRRVFEHTARWVVTCLENPW